MICPFASWRPVVNHGGYMAANLGLVVHVQVGQGSLYDWFDTPSSEVSAHFWVSAGGFLEQYVDTGTEAWAEMAGNSEYVSIETEGHPEDPLTYAQQGILAALIAWGHEAFGWPLELVDHGGHGVTTHAHYPSGAPDPAWGDHACPGELRTLQLPKVLDAAKAIARPV